MQAILLINLGSPDAPTAAALRPYLREFLSDKRVIELPRYLWLPILHGIILNTRPRKSAKKYAQIWTDEGSPLLKHTQNLARNLAQNFVASDKNIIVDFAMRYGKNAIGERLQNLEKQGVTRVLILPLYPQFSASTTGSAQDEVCRYLLSARNPPEIHFCKSFATHPSYIAALTQKISSVWQEGKLIMSFHGLPQRMCDLGDPYFNECHETAKALASALNLNADDYAVSFQSRFLRGKWLTPSTIETLKTLAKKGESACVVCPGFIADCLETLEEIAITYKAAFHLAGGKNYTVVPCLNAEATWLKSLATSLVNEN